jgi:hypothetical protein
VGQLGINSLRILQTMSSKSEEGADGKQSAGVPDVTVEQLLYPTPSLNTEIAVGDKRQHVAIDKPYSVFTRKEKWSIVILASCAAIFRRVRCICICSTSLTLAHSTRTLVLSLRTYTSPQFPSSQQTSTKAWNSSILPLRCTWSCRAYVRFFLSESGLKNVPYQPPSALMI